MRVFILCSLVLSTHLMGCFSKPAPLTHSTPQEPVAEFLLTEIEAEYPKESYIAGIGEIEKTDDALQDKKMAEMMARLEMARQIKVRVMEKSFDLKCEAIGQELFKDAEECRNEFAMLVEQTVDVSLEGSRIIRHGEKEGVVYAVAVLPRESAVKGLESKIEDLIRDTKASLCRAKEGDNSSLQEIQREYMKALAFDHANQIIGGVESRFKAILKEFEEEISALKKR